MEGRHFKFITFVGLVSEVTSTYVAAENTDYHRRPYVWIMGGTYAALRGLTFIVIGFWVAAAYTGRVRGMRIAFDIIFVRVIGNLLHGLGSYVWDSFIVKDTLSRRYRLIIHPELIPKDVSLITLLIWTIVECMLLDRMNHYELLCARERSPLGSPQVIGTPPSIGASRRELSPPALSPVSAVRLLPGKADRPGSSLSPGVVHRSSAPNRILSPKVSSPSSGVVHLSRAPNRILSPRALSPSYGIVRPSSARNRRLSPTVLSPSSGVVRPSGSLSRAGSPKIMVSSPKGRKIQSP